MHRRYYERHYQDFKRNKKLAGRTSGCWGDGGAWFDEEQNRYIRTHRSSYSKYLKKMCNRRYRRKQNGRLCRMDGCFVGKNNRHKRVTDLNGIYF